MRILFGLPTKTERVYPPFSPQQIALLNRWQAAVLADSLRCPRHGKVLRDSTILVAHESGWQCHFTSSDYPNLPCSYTHDCAYAGMLDEVGVEYLEKHGVQYMNVSLDDATDQSDLLVFSGQDLAIAAYDQVDLNWEEVAERTTIDERRGLVVVQTVALEDLVDVAIIAVESTANWDSRAEELARMTIGPRIDILQKRLAECGKLNMEAIEVLRDLRRVVQRRNRLAHGDLGWRQHRICPHEDGKGRILEAEWVLIDRRSGAAERITLSGLRRDLEDAIGCYIKARVWADGLSPRPSGGSRS